MGAGKTTVGNLLAARLELPFADSDQVIEHRAGRPVSQIFAEDGEPAFRALEHQVIAELLYGPEMVLALGCGASPWSSADRCWPGRISPPCMNAGWRSSPECRR